MSKRPAFQFYVGDWLRNAKLRRCSPAARGAWIDVLCLLHDSDQYGVLRWPLADIAQAAGVPVKLLRELADKGVLKGSDGKSEAYVYTPRHAGQDGEPVTLIAANDGPCWYCSRFVRDEHVRQRRGAGSRFDSGNQPQPKAEPKSTPNPPNGGRQGDGASTAFASASAKQDQKLPADAGLSPLAGATGDQTPPATVIDHPQADRVPYERIVDLYHEILPMLPRVAALTDKRKSHIRARWKSGELPDLDTWRAYFTDVSRSDFLCGRAQPAPGRRVFFADIDWLTNQANLVKFQEGKYDNSGDRRHG